MAFKVHVPLILTFIGEDNMCDDGNDDAKERASCPKKDRSGARTIHPLMLQLGLPESIPMAFQVMENAFLRLQP